MTTVAAVVVGRNCAAWLPECVASIDAQTLRPAERVIVDDASTDSRQRALVRQLGLLGWRARVNPQPVGAMANIDLAVRHLLDDSVDVVVLVDGDDALACPDALARIADVYADPDVWTTYGSYETSPPDDRAPVPAPYPAEVIAAGTFRRQPSALFNHPLTFRRRAYLAIPPEQFRRPDVLGNLERNGRWVRYLYDEAIMYPLLELAGERHRFLTDVLYRYTTDNPASCNQPGTVDQAVAEAAELRARPMLDRLDVLP